MIKYKVLLESIDGVVFDMWFDSINEMLEFVKNYYSEGKIE